MYFVYITLMLAVANHVIAGQYYYSAPRAVPQQYYTPAPVQQYYTPTQYYQNTAQPFYQRQQQYYQRPTPQPYYQNQAPVFYQRSYTPVQQYVVPQVYRQQTFGYQHSTPVQYVQQQYQPQYQQQQQEVPVQVQANSNFNDQSRGNAAPEAAAEESKTSVETSDSNNFRGFAYHTEYENGGRSNVVFIQGPEVNRFQSAFRANLTRSKDINIRTSASDAVDTNAESEKPQRPRESFEALVNFLENPQSGVQRFYSVNNALIARNADEEFNNFPASTVPLRQPISPLFPLLSSRFYLAETTTAHQQQATTTEETNNSIVMLRSEEKEQEGSASETKSVEITSEINTSTATTEAPSSTTAEAPSSTTPEAPSSTTVEAPSSTTPEAPSSTTAEAPSSTTAEVTSTTETPVTSTTTARSTMQPIIVEDMPEDMETTVKSL